MKTSTRRIVSLILNAFIVVSTAYVYRDSTVETWRFFTNLSNVLAALTSLIMVVFSAIQLNRERKGVTSEKPFWLSVVRMFAAVCMTLTFVIVVIFLSPMEVIHGGSYFRGFSDQLFHMHFLTPILTIAAFLCFDGPDKKPLVSVVALVPVAVYGIVYACSVLFLKRWPDFYGFTFGGNPLLSVLMAVGIMLVAWGISTLLVKTKKRVISS